MKLGPHRLLIALVATPFFLGSAQAADIHDAARADDVARIEALLATNATLVHATGKDEMSPLHTAARGGKLNALQVLLEHGADVNARDTHHCRPLHSTVYGGHVRAAEILLDHGADVNAARKSGGTALYFAAGSGSTNLVGLLLEHGAKLDAASNTGFTPLHVAASKGDVAVAETLVAAGAKVDAPDKEGRTPLHVAASASQLGIAECLLDYSANADANDQLGFKPLDYVKGATNDTLASLLARHMKPRLEQALPMKVGEAGDTDRIVFEGLHSFTSEQIRHALAVKPSYRLAAHPQANMRVFLNELKFMVESGYHAAGFPDAEVRVTYDERAFLVRVNVGEGPRFRAADIHVRGARSVDSEEVVNWFTTWADTPLVPQAVKSASASTEIEDKRPGGSVTAEANLSVGFKKRPGGLGTPGKASRPDGPMWVNGEQADFSAAWRTQAVAQVEACLAEQGYFFPKVTVDLQRDDATGTADLFITLEDEGPPGIVGEITVTGVKRHTPADIIRFLGLHEGWSITAERLAAARQKLRDCGRFQNYRITPEYIGLHKPSSRRVHLHIEVVELDGVPTLAEPLSPKQEALLRLCEWIEQFPERNQDIRVAVTNRYKDVPMEAEFVLSPRRGLLLDVRLEHDATISAGLLIGQETVQLCSWTSGVRLAGQRESGRGRFFLHLLPNPSGSSNRFNLALGAAYSSAGKSSRSRSRPALEFDMQLSRAAFLDKAAHNAADRFPGSDVILVTNGLLVISNSASVLQVDASTGELVGVDIITNQIAFSLRHGSDLWDTASREFLQRSEAMTNQHRPGRGLSSFVAFVAREAAQCLLLDDFTPNATGDERTRALTAVRKLLDADLLPPMDHFLGGDDTNRFSIPKDEVDEEMARNSPVAFFSGFVFRFGDDVFPKYSWPWTAAREMAFVLMSRGRYTDVELERLYRSEDTGPIGCLVVGRMLSAAGSPAAKRFALQGIMRLDTEHFLRDCHLFLRGESSLALSFARMAETLRTLPEEELAALAAVLPEAEATLLRESAAALRADPDAPLATALAPAIGRYWEEKLQAEVRDALHQLTSPRHDPIRRAAAVAPANTGTHPVDASAAS